MSVPFISNLGFTTVDTAGTLNTKAGSKDALPVQFYRLTADITGTLTINNNANHAKIILDMNNRNLLGASGTGTASTPIVYNGTGTVDIKGGGLISSGGTLPFASGSRTGSVTVTPSSTGGTDLTRMTGNVTTSVSTTNTNQSNQTVSFTTHQAQGHPDARSRYYARVPSGVTLVMTNGTTYGAGTNLSTYFRVPSPKISSNHVTEIFGTNGTNSVVSGTRGTGLGGSYTNVVPQPQIYGSTWPGSPNNAGYANFRTDGSIRFYVVISGGTYNDGQGNVTSWTVSGLTKQVAGRTFAVTNNSGGQISYTTPTGSQNINNGATASIATTNNTSEAFSFTGSISSVRSIGASGTGDATVQVADGGDGATGTVVIAISGANFTVTNNNDNPINFVAGTGSGNVPATATSVIVGSGTSWSYTGQKPQENSSNEPLAGANAFGGTGVTVNSDGEPTGGIDTTNFTGEFNRTS